MRRSISARLFLGFLVVLVAFGGVMGYTFYRLHRLRQELTLINRSYLPLVMTLAKLDTLQGNLLTHIAERSLRGGSSKFLWTQVRLGWGHRQHYVRQALKVARESRELGLAFNRHDRFMDRFRTRLRRLKQAFRDTKPLFDQLFPGPSPVDSQVAGNVGEKLSRLELRLARQIKTAQRDVRKQIATLKTQIKVEEQNAFLASLITMVIALLVSLVVTIGSQLMLRPLKRLVAGTKQIASGDYNHRVEVRSRNELGALAQEFNSMAAAIEEREQRLIRSERMAAAGQIASHITHEIRNPLSSISLNTELLEEEIQSENEGDGAGESRKLCDAIRREVDRLTDITEEYLRFARLPRPQLKSEDINEILLDLLSFVSTELKGKQIDLLQELAPELPTVDADENQLRQAFLNLLRNAGEAMASAGGALRVVTKTVGDGHDSIEVTIADTGVGISEDNLDKLFEPFFSTKETGTGLGLPLTQQIIQEHGGSIEVDSAHGKGTVFTVRLPVAANKPS